jgi:PPOX class probable F420-dependent enzyme
LVSEDHLATFRGSRYLNLETFRRNGQGVRTPLWFVQMDGLLYVRTPENSGKVKRLRNNPRVRVVASDAVGKPEANWMEGTAQFVGSDQAHRVNELLKEKYGWQKALIDFGSRLRKRTSVVIAIQV